MPATRTARELLVVAAGVFGLLLAGCTKSGTATTTAPADGSPSGKPAVKLNDIFASFT